MRDSSESLSQERPRKCKSDELLAPVTPTPNPCPGPEKAPPNGHSSPGASRIPKRSGSESGAPPPQPAFSFKSSRSPGPLLPSPAAPEEIRNWSLGERTGASAASAGSEARWTGPKVALDPVAIPSAGVSARQGSEALGINSSSFKDSHTWGWTAPLMLNLGRQ